MSYSVEIKNLDLRFGNLKVLENLNLGINNGEFLVLLGSSGCGKSTLLNSIAGLLEISDGQIFINGQNVTWAEPSERGIGMVFQSYALYPQMTVEGNLSFGLKNAKLQGEHQQQLIDNKKLDWHIARLRESGKLKLQGIEFSVSSPYYNLCEDVLVKPKMGQVLPHRHVISSPLKVANPSSPDKK